MISLSNTYPLETQSARFLNVRSLFKSGWGHQALILLDLSSHSHTPLTIIPAYSLSFPEFPKSSGEKLGKAFGRLPEPYSAPVLDSHKSFHQNQSSLVLHPEGELHGSHEFRK